MLICSKVTIKCAELILMSTVVKTLLIPLRILVFAFASTSIHILNQPLVTLIQQFSSYQKTTTHGIRQPQTRDYGSSASKIRPRRSFPSYLHLQQLSWIYRPPKPPYRGCSCPSPFHGPCRQLLAVKDPEVDQVAILVRSKVLL